MAELGAAGGGGGDTELDADPESTDEGRSLRLPGSAGVGALFRSLPVELGLDVNEGMR